MAIDLRKKVEGPMEITNILAYQFTWYDTTDKIYILPLTAEDYNKIRKLSSYKRIGDAGRGQVVFTISNKNILNLEPSDIMTAHGFAPEGYGNPFEVKQNTEQMTFKCWGSCD